MLSYSSFWEPRVGYTLSTAQEQDRWKRANKHLMMAAHAADSCPGPMTLVLLGLEIASNERHVLHPVHMTDILPNVIEGQGWGYLAATAWEATLRSI